MISNSFTKLLEFTIYKLKLAVKVKYYFAYNMLAHIKLRTYIFRD